MMLQSPMVRPFAIASLALLLFGCDSAPPVLDAWQHSEGSYAASFSDDKRFLVTAGTDSEVRLWNIEQNTIAFSWQSEQKDEASTAHLVAFSRDATVTASVEHNTVMLWQTATGTPLNRLVFPYRVRDIALSPSGNFLLLALANRSAIYFDVRANQVRHIFEHDGAAVGSELNHMLHTVAISPDGETALTGGDDRTARLWDLQSGELIYNWVHGNNVNLVAFDPQGEFVLTAADNDHTHLWDLSTGQKRVTLRSSPWPEALPVPNFPVFFTTTTAVGFSEDGRFMVTGHSAERLCVWQLPMAEKQSCWKVPRQYALTPGNVIQAVAFTAGDRSIQSVGGNGWSQQWQWR